MRIVSYLFALSVSVAGCEVAAEETTDVRTGSSPVPLAPGTVPGVWGSPLPTPPPIPCTEFIDGALEIDPLGPWCDCMGRVEPDPIAPPTPVDVEQSAAQRAAVSFCTDVLFGDVDAPDIHVWVYCADFEPFIDMRKKFQDNCSALHGGGA